MRSAPLRRLPLLLLTALFLAGCGGSPLEPDRDWMMETIFDTGEVQVLVQDRGYLIRMTGAYYDERNGERLEPEFEALLDRFAEVFPRLEGASYFVNVHSGSIHIDPLIHRYSIIHAEVVATYLRSVPGGMAVPLRSEGHGGYFPLIAEDTPEAEAVNRRIDIMITLPETQ